MPKAAPPTCVQIITWTPDGKPLPQATYDKLVAAVEDLARDNRMLYTLVTE